MKLTKYLTSAFLAAWLALAPPAFSDDKKEQPTENNKPTTTLVEASAGDDQEKTLDLSLTADFLNLYNFRGFKYSEGPVTQLVPSATYGNFSLVGFANYGHIQELCNEQDLTLDYTTQLGKLWLSLGYTYLTFPHTNADNTHEVYLIASLETLLNPSLTLVQDLDDFEGGYAEAKLRHDINIGRIPFSITALLAYNNEFMTDSSGFSHAKIGLSTQLKLTDGITIKPMIEYSEALQPYSEDMFVVGLSLQINF